MAKINSDVLDKERIVAEEDLVIDAQFLLQELMNERGISRAELARLTGVSKARISQLLSSGANPTLRTLATLAHALGDQVFLSRKKAVSDRNRQHEAGGGAVGKGRLGPFEGLAAIYEQSSTDNWQLTSHLAANDWWALHELPSEREAA